MLAHAGGLDEVLMPAGLLLSVVAWSALRRMMPDAGARNLRSPCPYCGRVFRPGELRCASCGFARRIAAREPSAPPAVVPGPLLVCPRCGRSNPASERRCPSCLAVLPGRRKG